MARTQKTASPAKQNRTERRLTIKSVIGKMKGKTFDQVTELVKVAGVITKVERGDGEFGAWAGFIGNFAAINMLTGEIIESQRLTLPDLDSHVEKFAAAQAEKKSLTAKISGILVARPREEDPTKYALEFIVNEAPVTGENPALAMLDF